MKFEDLNASDGIVADYQSTYVIVSINGQQMRFDFKGKTEYKLKKNTGGKCSILLKHPLLIDYNEPWSESYINSIPMDPKHFVDDMRIAIERVTNRWRNWKSYVTKGNLFTFDNFLRNVSSGNGFILNAPSSLTKSVAQVCEEHSVAIFTSGGLSKLPVKKVFFVGKNYVIADDLVKHVESSS
jgi:hypothetical protein